MPAARIEIKAMCAAPAVVLRQIFRLDGHVSETLPAGIADHGFELMVED